jgi:hypothetical protein
MMTKITYGGYRFPPEIIQQAIWLYIRFTLSFRDVEDLLAERGIGRWILTRSATLGALGLTKERSDFPLPRRRLPLHFEDAKAAPRKGKSSRLKALRCCTSRRNSGAPSHCQIEHVTNLLARWAHAVATTSRRVCRADALKARYVLLR